jgi:hypothetical protein
MIKVRFLNFWPNFEAHNSLFYFCLQKICKTEVEIIRDPARRVDLQIESAYPQFTLKTHVSDRIKLELGLMTNFEYVEKYRSGFVRNSVNPTKKRIWYTAENLRAPHGIFDLTIGFDPTDKDLRNLYFPFWKYRMDWQLGNKLSEIAPKPIDLVSPRQFNPKRINACAFTSTRDVSRLKLFEIVNNVIDLDIYGSAFANKVNSKAKVANNYLFQVCPENVLYPGYITEKLTEAWHTGNIPIWSGLHVLKDFNPKSYIDVTNLTSEQITNELSRLGLDTLESIFNEPLLHSYPTIQELLDSLMTVIDTD